MATKKMTKTEPVKTEEIITEEPKEVVKNVVDADALIKSILSNTQQQNTSNKKYIICRSVTDGCLCVNCRSGNMYKFTDYGFDCEIEYDDLVALVRKRSDHVFEPRFIIEDEAFLAEFPQVSSVYENMYTRDELDEVFEQPPAVMVATIREMPDALQKSLKSIIASKIADGSIDSVRKIRALSEYYNSDFNLLSELFSK